MRRATKLIDLLVGIEVGVLGAFVALAWFAIISPVVGQPWWIIPNLFASALYSEYHVRAGASAVTWVGAAIHVVVSGMIGAINGLLTPGGRLFGIVVATTAYVVCYLWLWKRIAPLMLVYASQPVVIAGCFMFGSVLGWHPWFAAHARDIAVEQPWAVTASADPLSLKEGTQTDDDR
jgi:hypothetical protein